MGIPDEEVAQVRLHTDLVALISAQAALRKVGRRFVGLCPFHQEKSPSFSVNAEDGFYYCFGCHASGDAITFVRETEHLDFLDAVRLLADKAGIALHEDAGSGRDAHKRSALYLAMDKAVDWYHERLLSGKDAGPARDYLRSRGYDGEIVRHFRLGWAPSTWDGLAKSLKLPEKVLADAGLGFVNKRGHVQDSFRSRVIFPICDPSGKPIALGGRILPNSGGTDERAQRASRPEPKYKNSQETLIYSKRRTLYGLNWAKKEVIATGEVVVCEGYTDVIGCHVAGISRAVATCGTALAETHFSLLRNFGKRIVLAYDQDAAGQSATARVYEWERRHEVDVAVALLPAGKDPGGLASEQPEVLVSAIGSARRYLQFRVDRVFETAQLETPEGRARAAEEALEAICEHPDDLVRDQYVMSIADRARIDIAKIRERAATLRNQSAKKKNSNRIVKRSAPGESRFKQRKEQERTDRKTIEPMGGPGQDFPTQSYSTQDYSTEGYLPTSAQSATRSIASDSGGTDRPGLEALRLAVHYPDKVAHRLDAVLFENGVQRRTFAALLDAESLQDAVDHAPNDVAALLRRVSVEEPTRVTEPLIDPIDAVIAQLLRRATRKALSDLRAQARSMGEAQQDLGAVSQQSAQVHRWLEDLDRATTCHEAEGELLAWVIGRTELDKSAG